MKRYVVPVKHEYYGGVSILAHSPEEALEIVKRVYNGPRHIVMPTEKIEFAEGDNPCMIMESFDQSPASPQYQPAS